MTPPRSADAHTRIVNAIADVDPIATQEAAIAHGARDTEILIDARFAVLLS